MNRPCTEPCLGTYVYSGTLLTLYQPMTATDVPTSSISRYKLFYMTFYSLVYTAMVGKGLI